MKTIDEFRICFHDLGSEFRVRDGQMRPIKTATASPPGGSMMMTLFTWESVLNAAPPKPRRSDAKHIKASDLQQLSILDPTREIQALEIFSGGFHLKGLPNMGPLKRGLNRMLQEHESLRTYHQKKGSRFIRRVLPPRAMSLPLFDLRSLPKRRRCEEKDDMIASINGEPFNMEKGPFLRAAVILMEDNVHIIHIAMRQSLSDKWSLENLMREWRRFC